MKENSQLGKDQTIFLFVVTPLKNNPKNVKKMKQKFWYNIKHDIFY